MALNKKFFPKVAAADALVPSENFNTVLYTGNGSTQRIGGYINRGGVFNGSSSEIEVSSSVLNINTISIFAWINLSTTSGFQQIVSNYSSSNTGWGLRINNGGYLSYNTAVAVITGTTILSTNTWYHVGVTIDSSGNSTKLYINGQEEGSTTYTAATYGSGNTNFHIGSLGNLNTQYFNGKIDQVRVFNKALSSGEVTTLYGETYASSTVSTTDIFSDGSGVALYQLDGNANDTGGVSGKFGSAAIFNGNGYINTGINNDVGTRSISLWFYYESSPSTTETLIGAVTTGSAGYEIRLETSVLKFQQQGQTGASTSLSNLNINAWNHVVGVINGSTSTLYLNGSSVGTGGVSSAGSHSLYIGSVNDVGSASQYYSGKIDDVRIYSDVLTSTEVGYIYNNTTASIPTDNLVAYYKLDGDARDEQQLYDGTATNVTYAYDGTATNVTYQEATKFTPDLVWIKGRVQAQHSGVFDSVRGADLWLRSGTTDAENNFGGGYGVTSFDSNGFTIGSGSAINNNGDGNVAWCFKGGGTAVSNTDGGVTSQVSANTDAGFSIATWTYSSGTNTVGHGLSSAPELIIYKKRNAAQVWLVFTTAIDGSLDYNYLNTDAFSNSSLSAPTNTVFSIDTGHTGDYVGYCFHSVDGYSKIGSYTGTGTTTTPIVETGFEPAFLMVKKTDTSGTNWVIWDNKRDTQNTRTTGLFPNSSSAEITAFDIDFLSNGFQLRDAETTLNASGGTYIYLAIAADPDTTTPTVENSFDVVTYSGSSTSGTGQTIQFDFNPDLVITKSRTSNTSWAAMDTVRGAGSKLRLNLTSAELDNTFGGIQSFNGDGSVTFEGTSDTGDVDYTGRNYVAYAWKAGDHDDNLPQINTEGSIDSVVSVNAEAGFSIVKYTGNGTAGSTIGHGLSSAPQMIIIKNLDGTANWAVYTETTGTNATLLLNSSSASTSVSNKYAGTNSTVFGVNSASDVNTSGNEYIAYCFHSVSGYQKIGSYTGNGTSVSSTNTITTGFQPRWIMFKCTTAADQWIIFDNARGTVANVTDTYLLANLSQAEADLNDGNQVEFLSNGFKITGNGRYFNQNSETYIYLAIK